MMHFIQTNTNDRWANVNTTHESDCHIIRLPIYISTDKYYRHDR